MKEATSHLSDESLIQLLKLSSEEAFGEIYERYWKRLFTAAANKLGSHEEAEDIVQQVFISIWLRREDLEIHSQLRSYLSVAVKYRVLKHLNARARHRHYGDEAAEEALLHLPDDSTQQWMEYYETNGRINNLVAILPEKCRLVFEMSRVEGYTHKQIAAELQLSKKTVEWYIGKAIKFIKSRLNVFFLTM
ncbi:RNA polymerase sigma-70 factor [Sphingobacterium sp. SYP-B4668]|uniref:RNA polymerase sigma-70 factor n=1 Tax=Sphingobacterium sp. SYP-B4668 TaxID=2996035 RepID=UPI0022DD0A3B|nr:RNA polymerase sigma-70 factor [Sphingobacterium sp. SYP-B4668]